MAPYHPWTRLPLWLEALHSFLPCQHLGEAQASAVISSLVKPPHLQASVTPQLLLPSLLLPPLLHLLLPLLLQSFPTEGHITLSHLLLLLSYHAIPSIQQPPCELPSAVRLLLCQALIQPVSVLCQAAHTDPPTQCKWVFITHLAPPLSRPHLSLPQAV